jgi:chorismate dehydratase
MARLRVSAISFLNTAPLMWDFEHGNLGRDFEVSYTVPSVCAGQLREGQADIGIIPVIAYATIPDLVVIPDVAIAARGPVRSILLVSKVPLEQIESVAVDTSSRTSVALTRIVLRKWARGSHHFQPMEPELERMLARCDAALLIGDPALTVDRQRYHVYDMAEEWYRHTGKPFVFAFWAVRGAVAHAGLREVFQRSRDHGLEPEHVLQIARQWAPRLGISEHDVVSYLTGNIHYHLEPECLEGLELFFEYCMELGILAAVPRVQFLGSHARVETGD